MTGLNNSGGAVVRQADCDPTADDLASAGERGLDHDLSRADRIVEEDLCDLVDRVTPLEPVKLALATGDVSVARPVAIGEKRLLGRRGPAVLRARSRGRRAEAECEKDH